MIRVMLNRPEFQYEVHSLVHAFFPGHEVKVCCSRPEMDSVRSRRRARAEENAEPEEPLFVLDISFACTGSEEDPSVAGQDGMETDRITSPRVSPGDSAAAEQNGTETERISFTGTDFGEDFSTAGQNGVITEKIFSLGACSEEDSSAVGQSSKAADWKAYRREVPARFTLTLTPAYGSVLHMGDDYPEADSKETKNELKRTIYRLLSSYTGRTLPWGSLTGIRPTKIARNLIDQGWRNGAIADYMRNTYLVSNEKTALAVSIANREHYLLQRLAPVCRKPGNAGMSGINAAENPEAAVKTVSGDASVQEAAVNTAGGDASKPETALDGGSRANENADPELFASGYSLYVGIPFCPSICLYCSFSSSPLSVWKKRVDDYLDTLCHEIDRVSELVPYRRPDTVYIGGGTPTTLEPAQLDRLLSKLQKRFDLNGVLEFTVEAGRPDSITREKLQTLKEHGVTRISINPQTMNQETLDFIGRRHTVAQTVEAFHLAREMGFDNINMDLIVGLPGEGRDEVEHTMQELSKLDPDSITVHSLAVKRAARLRLFREEHKELTMENSSEIMNMTAGYAQRFGLYPYYLYRQKNMAGNFENVGYAREGREGLYNILIMEEIQTILALGAGAASKLVHPGNRIERVANVKDIKGYMERIDEMIERKRSALYGGNHADL